MWGKLVTRQVWKEARHATNDIFLLTPWYFTFLVLSYSSNLRLHLRRNRLFTRRSADEHIVQTRCPCRYTAPAYAEPRIVEFAFRPVPFPGNDIPNRAYLLVHIVPPFFEFVHCPALSWKKTPTIRPQFGPDWSLCRFSRSFHSGPYCSFSFVVVPTSSSSRTISCHLATVVWSFRLF